VGKVTSPRPYHHGDLRDAVIDAAVQEVEQRGAANLSMREIARRAGVSHAAPAHHFGDKAGIFTAIATEGFQMIRDAIAPVAGGRDGFVAGGIAYVQFALEHPGHFEVMFRPDLHHRDDPDLVAARDAAFGVLFGSAAVATRSASIEQARSLALAGWSASHGFATLWLSGNLEGRLDSDPAAQTDQILRGYVALGQSARHYLATNKS
jgi:AcrR family transcriptional regulator